MMPIIESQAQRDALIERAKKWEAICNIGYVTNTDKLDMLIARIALAALSANVAGETVRITRGLQRVTEVAWKGGLVPGKGSKIYTAPPVPLLKLPDDIQPEDVPGIIDPTAHPDEYACCVGRDVWNACIAKIKILNGVKE